MYRTFLIILTLLCCVGTEISAVDILRIKTFTDKDGLSQNTIYHILQDHQGFIWINAAKWINRYDGKEFRTLWSEKNERQQLGRVLHIAEDEQGVVWFRTASGRVKYYDSHKESFEDLDPSDPQSLFDTRKPTPNPQAKQANGKPIPNARFITDNKGYKWVYNDTGVLWQDKEGGIYHPLPLVPPDILSLISLERYDIFHDSRGIIWITTFGNGLFAIDPATGQLDHFTKADGLPTNYLHCVTEDRSGEIWVGTDYSGMVKISVSKYPVKPFYPAGEGRNDRSNAVRVIYEDTDSRYWFGTRDGELFVCDSLLQTIARHHLPSGMPYAITEDTLGRKWVVTRSSDNVMIFPRDGRAAPRTIALRKDNNRVAASKISSVLCDNNGRIWLSSFGEGLFLAEKKENHLHLRQFPMRTLAQNNIRNIIQTSDGLIWGSSNEGAIVFDPDRILTDKDSPINFHFDPDNKHSLSYNEVKVIFEDSQQRLWLGTAGGGLNLLIRNEQLEKSTFKHYNAHDGLFNEAIQAIEEDNDGFLWIGTESSISKFDPRTGHFDNFFFSEDRNANIFDERASRKRHDGRLMFGTYNGVYIFNPSEIFYDTFAPPVVITGLQVNGNEVVPGTADSPLPESITLTKSFRLKHKANSFNLQFAMLNYATPELNQYTYILEGYEKTWNPVSRNNIAAYRNVPPGKYLFKIKGSNSFGVWADRETTLAIHILPPWWASWWAIMIYAAFAILAFYITWRVIQRVNKLKMAVEIEKQVAEFKERLFTNVAHEFRTPLTIIRSAVERITGEPVPKALHGQTYSLLRSTDRLLLLTEQLLDFHKARHDKLELRVAPVEAVSFIHDIFSVFHIAADNKQINLTFHSSHEEYLMPLDIEKWNKIIYNLLSNAFKHTPANGTIAVELTFDPDNDRFDFTVSDSGSGIPEEMRKELFDRFMQVSYDPKGSGLGLNLTAELVTIHKGRITYTKSTFGGASFTVSVPLREKNYNENEIIRDTLFNSSNILKDSPVALAPPADDNTPLPYHLLVIEDEPEIRTLLSDELGKYYHVISTDNGAEGLKTAVRTQPDLILCDVMMPGIDGYETTRLLKNNFETSHIPVVLLTALTADSNQLMGIETGAEAYITKPFSLQYLLARVGKLIEQRVRLKEKFSREPGTTRPDTAITDVDTHFLDSIHHEIEANIDNSQFKVDNLIKITGTSRSVFYQKFKSLTGFTPNEYLRVIRLKKAADLLINTDMRISDIAYGTGFDDPLYFSKLFKAQFGKSPRQYSAAHPGRNTSLPDYPPFK